MTTRSDARTNKTAIRIAALLCALLWAVGVYVLWRFFVGTKMGQTIEEAAFLGSVYGRSKLWTLAEPILSLVSGLYVVVAIVVVAAIALMRKRLLLAAQVVTIIVGANVTTQIVKRYLFDRPEFDVGWALSNSLPSGHTTVAASTSLALLIAVPRRFRPFVALLGAGYTAAMGVSTLVGQWHRPSDVYAAILVAGVWATLVTVFSTSSTHDSDPRRTRTWTAAATIVFGLVAVIGALAAVWFLRGAFQHWDTTLLTSTELQRNAYIGSVAAVGVVSALVFGTTLVIRQAVARMR